MISPEGCASILWKSAERALMPPSAKHHGGPAEGPASDRPHRPEPAGGAHRDPVAMMGNLKKVLASQRT